jgi:protoheme IX farnesyltransferase
VLLYTIILFIVTLLPWLTGMSQLLYLLAALGLNVAFLTYSIALKRSQKKELPMKVFHFSVQYLMWLFLALLVDHYLPLRLF